MTPENRRRFPGSRVRRLAVLVLVGAGVAATALSYGAGARNGIGDEKTNVDILVSPNPISIGDAVTINGVVWSLDEGHPVVTGGDLTVRRFSGPNCTLIETDVATLTTDARGEYTFTDTPPTPPPLSYRVDYGGAGTDNDGDSGEPAVEDLASSSSTCVTVGSTRDLSAAAATGTVSVDGTAFDDGVIDYGSKITIAPGAVLDLGTSVGHVVLSPTGAQTTIVPTRTTIVAPTKTNKHLRRPVVVLRLLGGNFSSCSNPAFRALAGNKAKTKRTLWAHGKGHYRTIGNYSSATVRGTSWLTQDTCAGTLTKVFTGVVEVRDFTLQKTVFVTAGHSYLARPPQG